jgi:transketolase
LIDREALGLSGAIEAIKGVYYLHKPQGEPEGVVLVQGAGAGRIFVEGVLPELKKQKAKIAVLYVTSRELFELLPQAEQERILPSAWKKIATAITDFTLPTVDCWLHSDMGRACALYPHKSGQYLGSAKASKIYEEAQMDASGQLRAIEAYMQQRKQDHWQ